ncbi:hypothetical protein B4U79_10724, partial [Dinothrombium tinctorium]
MTSATANETTNSADDQKAKSPTTEAAANAAENTAAGGQGTQEEQKDKVANDGTQQEEQKDAGAESPSHKAKAAPKPSVHKPDYQPDVVYVYQFPRCPTTPSVSPYCLKLETWLRMAGIKYE